MNDREERLPRLRPRIAERRLSAALDAMPVVVVLGARPRGKSTLTHLIPESIECEYGTFDDFHVLCPGLG